MYGRNEVEVREHRYREAIKLVHGAMRICASGRPEMQRLPKARTAQREGIAVCVWGVGVEKKHKMTCEI